MTLAAMQHRRQQAKLQRKQNGRAPMLVMRGIRNDRVELNERMAAQAFISGFATTDHYQTLADMHSVMQLAGSTEDSRKWAYDYCKTKTGPTLERIASRYKQSGRLSATTAEKEVLREFVTRYREFWLRQPTELYVCACNELQRHYDRMNKDEPTSDPDRSDNPAAA